MFGKTYRARYGINYLMNLVFISGILMAALGRNVITGDVNLGAGFDKFWGMIGGVKSLGLLAFVVVAVIAFGYGLITLANEPRVDNIWVGIAGASIVLLVLWAGNNWFNGPTGTGMLLFGYFAAIAVLTALVTTRQRNYMPN